MARKKAKQVRRPKSAPKKVDPIGVSNRRIRECLLAIEQDERELSAIKDTIISEGRSISERIDKAQSVFEAMACVGANPNEWVPATVMCLAWASRRTVGRWVAAGELEGRYLAGKLYVRPVDFFAVQRRKLSTEPPVQVAALNQ